MYQFAISPLHFADDLLEPFGDDDLLHREAVRLQNLFFRMRPPNLVSLDQVKLVLRGYAPVALQISCRPACRSDIDVRFRYETFVQAPNPLLLDAGSEAEPIRGVIPSSESGQVTPDTAVFFANAFAPEPEGCRIDDRYFVSVGGQPVGVFEDDLIAPVGSAGVGGKQESDVLHCRMGMIWLQGQEICEKSISSRPE